VVKHGDEQDDDDLSRRKKEKYSVVEAFDTFPTRI
jgi:hypothetical protein